LENSVPILDLKLMQAVLEQLAIDAVLFNKEKVFLILSCCLFRSTIAPEQPAREVQ
jgi:hypothetical protein